MTLTLAAAYLLVAIAVFALIGVGIGILAGRIAEDAESPDCCDEHRNLGTHHKKETIPFVQLPRRSITACSRAPHRQHRVRRAR